MIFAYLQHVNERKIKKQYPNTLRTFSATLSRKNQPIPTKT